MELFQIYWDETQNLILEFRKDDNGDDSFDPARISRLSLKYEIIKTDSSEYDNFIDGVPSLVSIKKFEVLDDLIRVPLDFSALSKKENLRINFSRLKIHFNSGKFIEYLLKDSYELSEIGLEPFSYQFFPIKTAAKETATLTSERIIAQEQSNLKSNTCTKTVIYQRNHARIPAHYNELIHLLKENNSRLESLEKSIKKLTSVIIQNLQNTKSLIQNNSIKLLSFNNNRTDFNSPPLKPPPSPPSLNKEHPILPIRRKLSKPTLILNGIRSPKLPFIGELKSVLQSCKKDGKEFNFRRILKPLSESELKKITLNDEELYKKEIEFFSRQMVKKEI